MWPAPIVCLDAPLPAGLITKIGVSARVTRCRVTGDVIIRFHRLILGRVGVELSGCQLRVKILVVQCGHAGGVWSSKGVELGFDVRDMGLDKSQVRSMKFALNTLDDGLDRSVPYFLRGSPRPLISWVDDFDVERVIEVILLSPIDLGIYVWLKNLVVIDIGGVAECLMK